MVAAGGGRAMSVFVHIGYHKTGTTWFQRHFFPNHGSLSYEVPYKEVVQQLVYPNPLDFDTKVAREHFQPALRRAEKAGKTLVLSAERLSGNPHSGGYDSKEIADRIKSVFPKAKIWITLRNQLDAISSNYRQSITEGGTGSVKRYLGEDPPERIPGFSFRYFEYDRLVNHYFDLFGRENVLVTHYEDFRADGAAYTRTLCDWLGIPFSAGEFAMEKKASISISDAGNSILRVLNVFSYYPSMA